MKLEISKLRAEAEKAPGTWQRILSAGRITADQRFVELPDDLNSAPAKSNGGSKSLAIPADQWPLSIKAMALLAKAEDRGIGDVIARIVGPIGGDIFKSWHLKTFGKSCGCLERQESFNQRYPLP